MIVHNITVKPNAKNLARRSLSFQTEFIDSIKFDEAVVITVTISAASSTVIKTSGEALLKQVSKREKNGRNFYVYQY